MDYQLFFDRIFFSNPFGTPEKVFFELRCQIINENFSTFNYPIELLQPFSISIELDKVRNHVSCLSVLDFSKSVFHQIDF